MSTFLELSCYELWDKYNGDVKAPPAKEPAMPTVEQVCEQWGLNDVDLEYTDADFTNLTTFKLFQQTYRPRIRSEYPKVPMSKLMMLVSAKWREFQSLTKADEPEEAAEEQEEEEPAVPVGGDKVDKPRTDDKEPRQTPPPKDNGGVGNDR